VSDVTLGTILTKGTGVGDGVTSQFAFTFELLQAADLTVFSGTTQVTNFSIAPNGNEYPCVGGFINFTAPPAAGAALLWIRILRLDQNTTLRLEQQLPSVAIELALDRVVMQVQQLEEQIGRCIQLPITDIGVVPTMPAGVPNDVLVWDSTGTNLLSVTPGTAMLNGISTSPIPTPGAADNVLAWDGSGHLTNRTPASLFAPASGITAPGATTRYGTPTFADTSGTALANGGTGSAGQVWTSNGGGGPATFQALPAGNTLIVPSDLGKNKVLSSNTYNMFGVKMSNGRFVQGGSSAATAKGNTTGFTSFSSVAFDPLHPPANSVVRDWAQNGSSLYVILWDGATDATSVAYSAGRNDVGQLGLDSNQVLFSVLTRVPYFIAAGKYPKKVFCNPGGNVETYGQAFWVDTNDDVWAAGLNTSGQLGDGTVVNIGTASKGIGNNGLGADTPVLNTGHAITDIQTQEGGGLGFSAILSNSVLYMTGDNTYGQLGQGNTTRLTSFTSVTLAGTPTSFNIIRTASAANTILITSATGGTLYVWGANALGQCGANFPTNQTSQGSALITGVASASFMGSGALLSAYALCTNGDLYTWGANGQNNLFLNNTTTQQTPSKVMSTTAAQVWGWRGNGGNANGLMYVLDTSNVMRVATNVPTIASFPTVIDTAFKATGAYRCGVPPEIQDGTETISDLVLVNYGLANSTVKAFILTSGSSLYASGYSGDNMTNNYQPTYAQPSYLYNNRLNRFLWSN
jgi:alpha-tubulin suppressor-like RCC1 family protein